LLAHGLEKLAYEENMPKLTQGYSRIIPNFDFMIFMIFSPQLPLLLSQKRQGLSTGNADGAGGRPIL
jgi:hypothetical protein